MQGIPSSPLLITPVRQKRYNDYSSVIGNLWNLAEQVFTEADKIVAIGYSFPTTDTKAVDLVRNTLVKRKNEIELTIVDPYADVIIERIGEEYARSAKSVSLQTTTFEEFIYTLRQKAPSLVKAASATSPEFNEWIERLWAFQSWPDVVSDGDGQSFRAAINR